MSYAVGGSKLAADEMIIFKVGYRVMGGRLVSIYVSMRVERYLDSANLFRVLSDLDWHLTLETY